MKIKQAICFLVCAAVLLINPIMPTYAMDGMDSFDMMNNMNMDMILEQSYHTIESVDFATDLATDNNMLNNQLNDMMFFPDLLDVINMGNTPAQSANDNLFNDITVAVDNGSWMPEFNNFFNNPTAEIPMDVEMMNVDMDSITVPAFQPMQDTIRDLNNNPDMNPFTNNSDSNNSSELQYASADTNIDGLDWNMETNPEKALLDVQPDDNTDMLNATGGEMFSDELSTKPIDNGSQNMDNNDIDNNTNIGENPVAGPQDDNIISTD